MNDKSFYTVIRRFRYQYKKYNALKELDSQYYDEHLREAYKNAENELMNTTAKIILMVFGVFIHPNNTEVEFSQDIDSYTDFGRRFLAKSYMSSNQQWKVIVDDKGYYDFVLDLLRHYYDE